MEAVAAVVALYGPFDLESFDSFEGQCGDWEAGESGLVGSSDASSP